MQFLPILLHLTLKNREWVQLSGIYHSNFPPMRPTIQAQALKSSATTVHKNNSIKLEALSLKKEIYLLASTCLFLGDQELWKRNVCPSGYMVHQDCGFFSKLYIGCTVAFVYAIKKNLMNILMAIRFSLIIWSRGLQPWQL